MIRVMILTGQSSRHHDWATSSATVGQMLDAARLFDISVATSPTSGADMVVVRAGVLAV
jgi:hypothetical protein